MLYFSPFLPGISGDARHHYIMLYFSPFGPPGISGDAVVEVEWYNYHNPRDSEFCAALPDSAQMLEEDDGGMYDSFFNSSGERCLRGIGCPGFWGVCCLGAA